MVMFIATPVRVVVKMTGVDARKWRRTVPGTESEFNKCQLFLLPLDLFSIRNTPFTSWLLNLTTKSHPGVQEKEAVRMAWGRGAGHVSGDREVLSPSSFPLSSRAGHFAPPAGEGKRTHCPGFARLKLKRDIHFLA